VAVRPGDSIWGAFYPDSGLNAYLFRSVEMDDLLGNGNVGDGLWNSQASSAEWNLKIENADTLYYVIENLSDEDLDLRDTVQLVRSIL
jgi:hypothetical protein